MRFISCPSKLDFARDIMNAIDVLAIVPFFVVLVMQVRAAAAATAAAATGDDDDGYGEENDAFNCRRQPCSASSRLEKRGLIECIYLNWPSSLKL